MPRKISKRYPGYRKNAYRRKPTTTVGVYKAPIYKTTLNNSIRKFKL